MELGIERTISKIFVYYIKPKKGLQSELIIDFYKRSYDEIDLFFIQIKMI